MTIAPVFLPPNQFDHFYAGGDRIGALRGGPGGPNRPEEWLGATTTRFGQTEQGLSRLPDGQFLRDAVDADPKSWLGEEHLNRYGQGTEVLVKLLDLGQRLPVHLHPRREFAKSHLGLTHGKTEAWFVLEAPEGATAGVGLRDAMSLQALTAMVEAHDSDGLLAALRTRTISTGDAVLVPSGLPHSVSAGVFVLEIQEPTDLSILLEWQGLAVDGNIDGHLDLGYPTALQAVELGAVTDRDLEKLVVPRVQSHQPGLASVMPAIADAYFRVHRMAPAATDGVDVPAGFAVILVTQGSGTLTTPDGTQPVRRGDALVIPWAAGPWRLSGDVVAMVVRPPAPDAPEAPW